MIRTDRREKDNSVEMSWEEKGGTGLGERGASRAPGCVLVKHHSCKESAFALPQGNFE